MRRLIRRLLFWFIPEAFHSHQCYLNGYCHNRKACDEAQFCLTPTKERMLFSDKSYGRPISDPPAAELSTTQAAFIDRLSRQDLIELRDYLRKHECLKPNSIVGIGDHMLGKFGTLFWGAYKSVVLMHVNNRLKKLGE